MPDAELVQRAKSLLDRLCENPRFAGSPEEARARELCKAELRNAGFDCREIPFDYSQFPARWGPPLSAAVQAATIIVVARMAMIGRPLAALILGAAVVAALLLTDTYTKRRWVTTFPAQRARSANLEATRGTPRVWLVAHLDSKAQTMPMLLRIAGSVALSILMLITVVLLLLALVGVDAPGGLWSGVKIAAVWAALPGISCFVANFSAGALDNASGVVAVVLAGQSAQAPRDLGILITSGEELGLAGARAWTEPASREIQVLNCDTVDDGGDWRCMYTGLHPQRLTDAARSVAKRAGERLRVGRLIPGILADNIAFADRGIAAVTLSRGTLATLGRIHTRRDNSNAVTGRGAAEASILLSALAKELT
jgi:hypothetical protein